MISHTHIYIDTNHNFPLAKFYRVKSKTNGIYFGLHEVYKVRHVLKLVQKNLNKVM